MMNNKQTHIDIMLHGESQEMSKPKHQQDFEEMMTAMFATPQGKEFKEYLEKYLRKPTWLPNEETHIALYREGARRFAMDLLAAEKDYK